MKTPLIIVFLFVLTFNACAQGDEFVSKKFNGYALTEALRKVKSGMAYLRDCQIEMTSGEFTESGFNSNALVIPANIRSIYFEQCQFTHIIIGPEDASTEIGMGNCIANDLSIDAANHLEIENMTIRNLVSTRTAENGKKASISLNNVTVGDINLTNVAFLNLRIERSDINHLRLVNCTLEEATYGKASYTYDWQTYKFFHPADFDSAGLREFGREQDDPYITSTVHTYTNYRFPNAEFIQNRIVTFDIKDCRFNDGPLSVLPIYNCDIDDFIISNVAFGGLDLFNTSINNNMVFENVRLRGINLYKCKLPESNVSGLDFGKFAGGKLYVFDPTNIDMFAETIKARNGSDSILIDDHRKEKDRWRPQLEDTLKLYSVIRYNGKGESQIKNQFLFSELINNYSKLYKIYKERGDQQSANDCYAEMKDLLTQKLKYQYHDDPSFKRFFAWQLAWLVKVYTNHGTDPALAITVSFWVIFAFGVFYFFFPSDWDTTSKGRLIQNYRDFAQKNDKGYFKPFLVLVAGFLVSFVNALTLSLNAYTTLGFGNIPTHGLARYACVVQGFIGWFMLSIFTVALINQVLA
jgi:uncharacterized protein YjbI with pentapeptide repeats